MEIRPSPQRPLRSADMQGGRNAASVEHLACREGKRQALDRSDCIARYPFYRTSDCRGMIPLGRRKITARCIAAWSLIDQALLPESQRDHPHAQTITAQHEYRLEKQPPFASVQSRVSRNLRRNSRQDGQLPNVSATVASIRSGGQGLVSAGELGNLAFISAAVERPLWNMIGTFSSISICARG